MTDSEPDFHQIGQYAKSLAEDVLFTQMAEATYAKCVEMGFAAVASSDSVFPDFTQEEFEQLMRAALTARHQEMFHGQSEEVVAQAVDQQMNAGFGNTVVHAIFVSFAEHQIFFDRPATADDDAS